MINNNNENKGMNIEGSDESNEDSKVEVEIKSSKIPGDVKGDVEADEKSNAHAEKKDSSETEDIKEEPAVKSPEQIISEYEEKIKELDDRYLRLAAEFDNFKKRIARQYEEMRISASIIVVNQILEVVDNFERALEASSNSNDHESLHTGAKLIYQQLMDILNKQGVEAIPAVGENFDPNLHEAIMQTESDDYPEGVIVSEMARGYKMNGRVIRFSKVVVSRGRADETGKSDGEE